MNLKEIEKEIIKVKDQKNNWKRISFLLNYCQTNSLFKEEFEKYTHWIESLNPKMGLNRSSLIRIKSAGQFWLELNGFTDDSKIEECEVEDSRIFTDYKTLLNKVEKGIISVEESSLKKIKSKILNSKVSRNEITQILNSDNEESEIKANILKLKSLSNGNKKVEALLKELEREMVA